MKIKMTNIIGLQKLESLQKLKDMNTVLPVVVGYRIIQNVQSLSKTLAAYNETRDTIIKKYSKDGISVDKDTDPKNFEECVNELKKIDQIEIEVEIEKIPISLLEDKSLPLDTIFMMDFMLEQK